MTEPTQEQIKELWGWCEFKFKLSASENPHYWIDPFGRAMAKLPPIDLNNLFKYAVPKRIRQYEDKGEHTASVWNKLFITWVHSMVEGNSDPALALFWAIWEVIKK